MSRKLADYQTIAAAEILAEVHELGRRLSGLKLLHLNSTKDGGGVAELLSCLLPLFNDLGLQADWQAIQGPPEFFRVTKAFHNALQGRPTVITPEMYALYQQVNEQNAKRLDLGADVVMIHDPQPMALVGHRPPGSKWIWRCHIDLSHSAPHVLLNRPERSAWELLVDYANQYDEAIFSLTDFAQNLLIHQHIIPPSIDPLSEKNRELPQKLVADICANLGIPDDRRVILQVSRFDRFKDPLGVIEAYRLFKARINHRKRFDSCLVLAGGSASDDPEGQEVLSEVRARAGADPEIHIIELPSGSHQAINALQRRADIIVQKSLREGFGLVVAEGLWKRKPVVATPAGGIKLQVLDGLTGFLASSAEELADRWEYLLTHPQVGERLGENGYQHIKQHFLVPRELRDYLRLLADLVG